MSDYKMQIVTTKAVTLCAGATVQLSYLCDPEPGEVCGRCLKPAVVVELGVSRVPLCDEHKPVLIPDCNR